LCQGTDNGRLHLPLWHVLIYVIVIVMEKKKLNLYYPSGL